MLLKVALKTLTLTLITGLVSSNFLYVYQIVTEPNNQHINIKITELRTILQRESQNSYKYIIRQNQSTTGKL